MITVQPLPQLLVVPGQPATFNVTAMGANLTYQWQRNETDIPTGATLNSYTIDMVSKSDTGMYRCVVSNSADAANIVPSDAVSLTVCKCVCA